MINHGRSLLLNINGEDYHPQYIGDEYIAPNFKGVALPSYLQTARRIIFGAQPERVFLNYRVRELLHTIHETELAEYLYALDPRVTYWPEPSPVFFNQRKYVRAEQIAGVYGARLFFYGNFNADNALGKSLREYTIRTSQNTDNYIVVEHDDKTFKSSTTKVNIETGLSSAVSIAGTNLRVRVGGNAINAATLMLESNYNLLTEILDSVALESVLPEPSVLSNTNLMLESGYAILTEALENVELENVVDPITNDVFDGSAWRVTAFAPPASVVSLLPILEVMGEPNLLELFGPSNYDQPYATFKNLWFDHPLAVYRLAGFTMAMIYRTEEIRRGQNG